MDQVNEAVQEGGGFFEFIRNLTPEFLHPLVKAYQDGGEFMWPIAIMMVVGSAIIIERLYMILFVYSTNSAGFMQKIQQLILDNNVDEAVKLCNTKKHAAIYQVFKGALVNADRPYEEIQEHIEVATLSAVPKLQKRMPYLFTIANVATLLGLLGTIIGLIRTFSAVGAVESSQKQVLLSAGISTAMNTTAFGLMVAIPCMLTYGFLFNKINTLVDEIDHYSGKLLLLLRTGSQYFDKFSSEAVITTRQTPQKLDPSEQGTSGEGLSYDPNQRYTPSEESTDTNVKAPFVQAPEEESDGKTGLNQVPTKSFEKKSAKKEVEAPKDIEEEEPEDWTKENEAKGKKKKKDDDAA